MSFYIKEELANAILNYLASKAYIEVWKMMDELQHLEKVEDKDDDSAN